MIPIQKLIDLLKTQTGGTYLYGGKCPPTKNPKNDRIGVDCSGLIAWGTEKLGQPLTGGSWQQLRTCLNAGLGKTVKEGIQTPGALLFIPTDGTEHVAMSLGDGTTIEARGAAYGIGSWPAAGRFQSAALIPGFDYPTKKRGNPDMLLIQAQGDTAIYLVLGDGTIHVPTPADVQKLQAAGVPYAPNLSQDLVTGIVTKG